MSNMPVGGPVGGSAPVGSVKSASPSYEVKKFHENDDTDSGTAAHHHTIGEGPFQAASGAVVRTLRTAVTGFLSTLNSLNVRVGLVEAAVDDVEEDIVVLQGQAVSLDGRLDLLEPTVEGLVDEVTNLDSVVANHTITLNAHETRLDDLDDLTLDHGFQLLSAGNRLNTLEDDVDDLALEDIALDGRLDSLEQAVNIAFRTNASTVLVASAASNVVLTDFNATFVMRRAGYITLDVTFLAQQVGTGTNVLSLQTQVDGVDAGGPINYGPGLASRASVGRTNRVLVTAGSHTVRILASNGSGATFNLIGASNRCQLIISER